MEGSFEPLGKLKLLVAARRTRWCTTIGTIVGTRPSVLEAWFRSPAKTVAHPDLADASERQTPRCQECQRRSMALAAPSRNDVDGAGVKISLPQDLFEIMFRSKNMRTAGILGARDVSKDLRGEGFFEVPGSRTCGVRCTAASLGELFRQTEGFSKRRPASRFGCCYAAPLGRESFIQH
jgi:hypothetical protein